MSRAVYDARFFVEHYCSEDDDHLWRTKEEIRKTKVMYVSVIVIHEVYRLVLEREGREIAVLRTDLLGNFESYRPGLGCAIRDQGEDHPK